MCAVSEEETAMRWGQADMWDMQEAVPRVRLRRGAQEERT
jgi:hypothetical protein